jgi:hypothetical protein
VRRTKRSLQCSPSLVLCRNSLPRRNRSTTPAQAVVDNCTKALDASLVNIELVASAQRLKNQRVKRGRRRRLNAGERRAAAQAEARRIVAEAEEQAASASKEAQRRQQALKMDISVAEDRLRKLAMGLHEVAGRLDGLLATPLERVATEPTGDESSLMDDLAPARETEEASM